LRAHIQDQKDGLADAETVCSPLAPESLCGADVAAVLGLRTPPYLPFCCFDIASRLWTLAVAFQPVQHH
jgi:NhaC family Na+:H+ antiporter